MLRNAPAFSVQPCNITRDHPVISFDVRQDSCQQPLDRLRPCAPDNGIAAQKLPLSKPRQVVSQPEGGCAKYPPPFELGVSSRCL